MSNKDFSHWLYGYCKLNKERKLTSRQLWIIKNHLNLVQAVEGYLSPRNKWLDESIVAIAGEDGIENPSEELVREVFRRYAAIE